MMLSVPWWILVVFLLIVFTGYMAFRTMRAETKLKEHYIEREGQVYMERLERERMKRQQSS